MANVLPALTAPVYALPVDLFRIWSGGVLFVYFLFAYRQTADFSDPGGVVDHRLCAQLFPPTRWSLFQPGLPGWVFRAVFMSAASAAVLVALGVYPRACAAFLFAAAVSTYRWNVLAAYLDDSLVHVLCLWLALLPVGHSLTLPQLLQGGDWIAATVPGTVPRVFMANMAIVYLVAGAYKFTSPMWRNGTAMHAALKMPIARFPEYWSHRHRHVLRFANYAALLLEPFFGLVFFLPPDSVAKWVLAASAVVFHLGIAVTLKIPYANAIMLGALVLAFGPEIMQAGFGVPAALPPPAAVSAAGVVALTLVAVILLMVVWEAATIRRRLVRAYSAKGWRNPLRSVLWVAGIFQSYRLFDWVDERNYHVRYELRATEESSGAEDRAKGRAGSEWHELPANALFPGTMRHLLLQSYLIGNVWLQMDSECLQAVRASLLARYAARYARLNPGSRTVEVCAVVQRVTSCNLSLTRGERRFLMRFRCRDGIAVVQETG